MGVQIEGTGSQAGIIAWEDDSVTPVTAHVDDLGNFTNAADTTLGGATANTLTLAAVPSSSTFGVSVTFTATISPTGPTGVVAFDDAGSVFDSATISGTTAIVSTTALSVGTHAITANYGGDVTYSASTSNTLSYVVSAGVAPPVSTPLMLALRAMLHT